MASLDEPSKLVSPLSSKLTKISPQPLPKTPPPPPPLLDFNLPMKIQIFLIRLLCILWKIKETPWIPKAEKSSSERMRCVFAPPAAHTPTTSSASASVQCRPLRPQRIVLRTQTVGPESSSQTINCAVKEQKRRQV
uniref:Uncharacterized protein n=1 Tax=Romanomermis culicivorax TaxID=13658 RepID=A0A915J0H1_ROMCU